MALENRPLILRDRVLLAKAETTTGTPISLTGTEGAFIVQCDDNPFEEVIDMDERPKMNSAQKHPSVIGAHYARMKFRLEMVGSASVPAWASVFLPACGFSLSSRTFTLNPFVSTLGTLTMALLEGTRWRKISGAMGNVKFGGVNGKFSYADCDFMGKLEDDADAATVTPTFPSAKPPRWANASGIALGSFNPICASWEVDAGCEVQMRESGNEACGYKSAMIADCNPTGKLDPEASLVATRAVQSLLKASTEEALSIIIGSTTDNIITIANTKTQVIKRSGGARGKKLLDSLDLQLNDLFTVAFS